ncbi:MAG TPA: xanthine dehydrogenase family protein subunit M [candidate division Zixibacteria bacterium]|nr:xanthine dehydrogenase family protein subunit M [candidate division Zixibacteria bacterium]
MKPAPFEYFAPGTIGETLELLSRYGEEGKILAGGQSLMPLMNLRLARPRVLIDINRLTSLEYIAHGADGELAVGALTRQRSLELSPAVKERNPLLAAAMPLIGHFQTRNRGTVGGSVVHADPAAELPAVSLALGAELSVKNERGERAIPAEDLFTGLMSTAIEPTELLTEIRFPPWRWGSGWAIEEVARRRGDFAMVGAIALIRFDGGDLCQEARLVLFGVGDRPLRAARGEQVLQGRRPEPRIFAEAAAAAAEELDPISDVHASAEYRKDVAACLIRRALQTALLRREQVTR